MKARLRCKECGFEMETNLQLGPSKNNGKSPLAKIKLDKDSLDKLLDAASGASMEELSSLGIDIDLDAWDLARERRALRKFLEENVRLCRNLKSTTGEKYVIATEPWQMGDSFGEVDLTSSEVKAMGVNDLRMIPGVTLQKKVYGVTRGRGKEILKGVKFITAIDVSGSMFTTVGQSKVTKALLLGMEIHSLCKKVGYEYSLVLFSEKAERVRPERLNEFWRDPEERKSYSVWNGGTSLGEALRAYTDEEWKDANVVIISDMALGDMQTSKEKIMKIARLTNSFKVIIVGSPEEVLPSRIEEARAIFPEGMVKILQVVV